MVFYFVGMCVCYVVDMEDWLFVDCWQVEIFEEDVFDFLDNDCLVFCYDVIIVFVKFKQGDMVLVQVVLVKYEGMMNQVE